MVHSGQSMQVGVGGGHYFNNLPQKNHLIPVHVLYTYSISEILVSFRAQQAQSFCWPSCSSNTISVAGGDYTLPKVTSKLLLPASAYFFQ